MGDYLKAPPPPRTKEQVLREARDQIDRGLFYAARQRIEWRKDLVTCTQSKYGSTTGRQVFTHYRKLMICIGLNMSIHVCANIAGVWARLLTINEVLP